MASLLTAAAYIGGGRDGAAAAAAAAPMPNKVQLHSMRTAAEGGAADGTSKVLTPTSPHQHPQQRHQHVLHVQHHQQQHQQVPHLPVKRGLAGLEPGVTQEQQQQKDGACSDGDGDFMLKECNVDGDEFWVCKKISRLDLHL